MRACDALMLVLALALSPTLGACSDSGGDASTGETGDTGASDTGDETGADETPGTTGTDTPGDAGTDDLDASDGDPDAEPGGTGDTGEGVDAGPSDSLGDADDDDAGGDTGGGDDDAGGTDTPADPDVDDTPDEGLALNPDLIAELCLAACTDMAALGCDFAALGGDAASCPATCATLIAEDGWWYANFACYSDTCDAALCDIGEAPLPVDPLCAEGCPVYDACDVLPALALPEDEPEVCLAACSGVMVANPTGLGPVLECATDALDPTCDQVALGVCLGGDPDPPVEEDDYCQANCKPWFDPTDANFCGPDTALSGAWDLDECLDACYAFLNVDSAAPALRMVGCLYTLDCEDPAICLEPPDEDDPGCLDACSAFYELCPASGYPGADLQCAQFCTGLLMNLGEGEADAGECVSAAQTCPATGDEQTILLYGCVLPVPDACTEPCLKLAECLPDVDQAYCEYLCGFGYFGFDEELEAYAQCTVDAGDSCDAQYACLPQPEVPDLCASMCEKSEFECGVGSADLCTEACTGNIGAGIGYLGEALCLLHAPCDDQLACFGLGLQPVPEACSTACATTPDTCTSYLDGCESACTGMVTGLGLDPSEAQCVVDSLGATCDDQTASLACTAGGE